MAEFHCFMREQKQLEQRSMNKRPDVGNTLSFRVSQGQFRARQNLYRVTFSLTFASVCGTSDFQVKGLLDLSTNCFDCARAQKSFLSIHREPRLRDKIFARYYVCNCLCAGLCQEAAFYTADFLFASSIKMLSAAIVSAGDICSHSIFF